MEAGFKIAKSKAQLVVEHAFWASLLANLKFVETESVPTLAVDGKHIFYNPEYVNGLTINQTKFAVAHEVGHCVFDHLSRRGNRDHRRWNMAGDYIINDMLVADKVGEIHPSWLHNPQLVQAGKHTDGVYNLLPDSPEGGGSGSGSGDGDGDIGNDIIEGNMSEQERKEMEQEWKVRTVQAAQAAKMCGKMSANVARFIDELVNPKVSWRDVLQRFVATKIKSDRSFSKPNRRFAAHGLYMPSFSGDALGEIVIAVDCSGSISNEVLTEFASEIDSIKKTMNPRKITTVYFDSEVSHVEEYGPEDELNIRPHGGGGTAFSPIFAKVEELNIQPECCVVLTDLYCNDFGNNPDYPVLWVSNGDDKAPWGEVITM